jgi:CRISPR-associated protein Cmr1
MPNPKDIPMCPAIPPARPTGETAHHYQVELITPMFGGGVEPRVNDPSFPIRPTTVRGQLQFWWRATVGARYATKNLLREEQSKVWGSTEYASPVQVLVENVQASDPSACAKYTPRHDGKLQLNWNTPFAGQQNALPYVLFPFQGQLSKDRRRIEEQPASYIARANFRLILRCPKELWPQVEPAVWAWANFGGVGGRTRRGCGAVDCKTLAPKDADDLKAMWQQYMPELFPPREWPTMASAILAGTPAGNAIEAWDQVIGKLRFFRQGNDFARDRGSPPSRSRFPEPDTIRRITDSWKAGHEPRDENVIPDGFPRAEFGLPIVFHFKDGKKDATDTRPLEPYDTVLQPFLAEEGDTGPKLDSEGFPVGETKDRMASPLILKPLRLAIGQSIPLILRLNTESPQRVELKNNKTHECLTRRRAVPVRHPDFASGSSPINGRSPDGSALEAFLKYIEENGFEEVRR